MRKIIVFICVTSLFISCAGTQGKNESVYKNKITGEDKAVDPELAGESPDRIILKSSEFIKERKYLSAFDILNRYDSANEIPEIQIKKVDVALNFFVKSLNHVMFAFKDLEKDEDLMTLRSGEGSFTIIMFNVPEIFELLIKKYPDNYKLHKTLGEFYYDVSHRYGGRWIISDEEIMNQYMENFIVANEHNVKDYMSLHAIGEGYLRLKKYKEALPYLLESIKLNPEYATSYYNAGFAYLFLDKRKMSLKYAREALRLYDTPERKADAARMIATTYEELKEKKNALIYYRKANKIQPRNYYTLKELLNLELSAGKHGRIKTVLNDFYELDPKNPTIYQDLIGIYANNKKLMSLIGFLDSNKKKYRGNDLVTANIFFYIGSAYDRLNKREKSKENFLKAREYFLRVYDEGHQVFGVIDGYVGNK